MNQKTNTDCCVQTDLDLRELEQIKTSFPKMISNNLFSGNINLKYQHLKIDVKNNCYSFQLRKVDTIEPNLNQQREKKKIYNNNNNKKIQNEYEQQLIRRKQFIPKSFHIETLNNIATPQQITLPQKYSFHLLHVLERKLIFHTNGKRFKTCPDDSKCCYRISQKCIVPEKIKHVDAIKALK